MGGLVLEGVPAWLLSYNVDDDANAKRHESAIVRKHLQRQARWDEYYLRKTASWLKGKLPVEQQRLVYYRKFKRRMCNG